MIQSINPSDSTFIQSYIELDKEAINIKIEQTGAAFKQWKTFAASRRSEYLTAIGDVLISRKQELAILAAREMGKPVKAGIAEVEKCAAVCKYYAENGQKFLQDEIIATEATKSFISYQPLGVVLAVMPWNFPYWQVFRFLAPTLLAGNCALLKHASNVPGCALAIEDVLKEAGLPEFVFQTLLIKGEQVEQAIEHPAVKAVSLTGSTDAGIKVAQKAASLLKKCVLELGGSDPYIILKDADLGLAAQTCAESRLINSGQSCIAAKRFIVEKEIEEKFIELFKIKMAAKTSGNPLNRDTQMGPLARKDLRAEVHSQVLRSIEAGAVCILGGEIPKGEGAFYPATILTNVKKGMSAFDEEIFGPVAAVIRAENEEHAVELANDTSFGLGAAIFTADLSKGEAIATRQLNAGSCFVNAYVKSDPRLPFGGINQSGYGRELGIFGIREFVNIKTVYIK